MVTMVDNDLQTILDLFEFEAEENTIVFTGDNGGRIAFEARNIPEAISDPI